ncbi:MAG: endolytic transglycosylase MltG, partial [Myxococcales bacterium]|nr:endolytic transglycosylase MltG [Myxococcales bacterium]
KESSSSPAGAPRRRWLKRSRRAQRWALVVVVATLAVGAYWCFQTYQRVIGYPARAGVGGAEVVEFEVPRGASLTEVMRRLIAAGVLPEDEALWFKVFVLHRGAAGKITAGEHHVRGDMTPEELLAELIRAQPSREVRVTIPEGRHTLEVAQLLADAGLGARDELVAAMRDPALLESLGVEASSAEGYLFPDTYKFKLGTAPEDVIRRLVRHHQQVYADLRRRHRDAAAALEKEFGWGDHEIVTFASLIEKETAARHERPRIASVFYNRLRFRNFQPKRLETDPTIIYGCTVPVEKSAACQQFEGRIRRIHLRDPDNPYNTYTHEGLPPGPITNPGRAALEAVLAPEKTRFLFFVAKNDGSGMHKFSKSRAEHEAAVDEYIRGK